MLVLSIFYILFILAHKLIENEDKANKVSNIIAIIGLINIPVIRYSVDWWNTLHQPASISKLSKPSIDPSMMTPLIIMTTAFIFIGLSIAILRIKTEIELRKGLN